MTPRIQLSPHQFAVFRILTGLFGLISGAALCFRTFEPLVLAAAGVITLAGLLVMFGVMPRIASAIVVALALLVGTLTMTAGNTAAIREFGVAAAALPFVLIALAPAGEPWRLVGRPDPAWTLYGEPWLIAIAGFGAAGLGTLGFFAVDFLATLIPAALLLFLFAFRWPGAARPTIEHSGQAPVVFFDGVCGLCNTAVDWIIVEDRGRIFRYAPIQGEFARRTLAPNRVGDMNTMLYLDERGLHERSDAVLAIGLRLGGLWKSAYLPMLLPRSWRNRLYDFISANRYRWFGKKESCRLPTPEERALFLM